MTFATSTEAMDAAEPISLARATAELANHFCRVIDTRGGRGPLMICVTNDCDPPEWIECNTRSILEFLGY